MHHLKYIALPSQKAIFRQYDMRRLDLNVDVVYLQMNLVTGDDCLRRSEIAGYFATIFFKLFHE